MPDGFVFPKAMAASFDAVLVPIVPLIVQYSIVKPLTEVPNTPRFSKLLSDILLSVTNAVLLRYMPIPEVKLPSDPVFPVMVPPLALPPWVVLMLSPLTVRPPFVPVLSNMIPLLEAEPLDML